MKREITKIRKEIIGFVWDNYKAKYNMSQLAQVFKMDLGNFYRILADKIPIIGKVVPDKKLGNKIVYDKNKQL